MANFQGIGKDDPRLGATPVKIGHTSITPYVEVVVVMSKMPGRFRGFLGILLVRLGTLLLKGKSHILLNSAGERRELAPRTETDSNPTS